MDAGGMVAFVVRTSVEDKVVQSSHLVGHDFHLGIDDADGFFVDGSCCFLDGGIVIVDGLHTQWSA